LEELHLSFVQRAQLFERLSKSKEFINQISQVGQLLRTVVRNGSIVLICGNGGSAAEAQHMAGEIVGRFLVEREGLPALALVADSTILTAVGNDYGYEEIFARQVTAYKDLSKLLILVSTSGNSKNLIRAAERAKTYGITTVGFLGRDGGTLKTLCDFPIVVPSWSTPEIQEVHLTLIHILCEYVDCESE
jgi:D-sedoheptulose 7-phosphate isomerase